jgi:hypothetical protein
MVQPGRGTPVPLLRLRGNLLVKPENPLTGHHKMERVNVLKICETRHYHLMSRVSQLTTPE